MKKKIIFRFGAFCFIIFALFHHCACFSQHPDEIRTSDIWHWGIGSGSTYQKAAKNSLDDMIGKISVVVESKFEGIVKETNETLEDYVETVVKTYSTASLQNVHYKVLEENRNKTKVLCYLSRKDLQKRFDDRKNLVIAYTRNGVIAEKKQNISDALRNYYWALVLLGSHPDYANIRFAFEDHGDMSLKPALYNKINAIFANLNIRVSRSEMEQKPKRKLIMLDITYNGEPVQAFDYIYFTGDSYSPMMSASDGVGVAEFYGAAAESVETLRIHAEYQYGNKAYWEPELVPLIENANLPIFDKSTYAIQLPISKLKLKKLDPPKITIQILESDNKTTSSSANTSFSAATIQKYRRILEKILKVIPKDQPQTVRSLFTPEGYKTYLDLIHNGRVRVLEIKDSLKLIQVGDEVMARSIPMLFAYANNQRKFIEDVVFLFNEEKKITDITFALSDIAIRDIVSMPEGFGTRESRYKLIRFMENYKTAYCLKQLDYITSIFAENALIIVGKVLKVDKPIDDMYLSLGEEKIRYNRYTKKQYIENLRRLFQRNEFVNIQFEDNQVRKVNTDDKIYGIQIAQHYYSSTYADKGYLFLMIDMNDTLHPKIYVRTWQPKRNPDGSIYGLEDFHI